MTKTRILRFTFDKHLDIQISKISFFKKNKNFNLRIIKIFLRKKEEMNFINREHIVGTHYSKFLIKIKILTKITQQSIKINIL